MFLIHDFNWNSAQISWEDFCESIYLTHSIKYDTALLAEADFHYHLCDIESFDETLIYIVQTFASFYFILDLYLVEKGFHESSFDNLRYFFHPHWWNMRFWTFGLRCTLTFVYAIARNHVFKFLLFFMSCTLRYWKFPAMCYRVACSLFKSGQKSNEDLYVLRDWFANFLSLKFILIFYLCLLNYKKPFISHNYSIYLFINFHMQLITRALRAYCFAHCLSFACAGCKFAVSGSLIVVMLPVDRIVYFCNFKHNS